MLPEQVAERVIDFCLTEEIPSWVDKALSCAALYESVVTPLEFSVTNLFTVFFAFIETMHFAFGDPPIVNGWPAEIGRAHV